MRLKTFETNWHYITINNHQVFSTENQLGITSQPKFSRNTYLIKAYFW